MLKSEVAVKKPYGYESLLPWQGKLIVTGKWFDEELLLSNELILRYFKNISYNMTKDFPEPIIFVTKDISFRIRVTLEGLIAEDYKTDKTQSYQKYGEIRQTQIEIKSVQYIDNNSELYKIKEEKN